MSNHTELIKRTFTGITILIFVATCYFYCWPPLLSFVTLILLGIILLFEWPSFNAPLLTPFYPVLPCVLIILMNTGPERELIPLIFLTVCLYETIAYCCGKLVGYHKLWASVSPGKTWEGVIGGYCFSVFFMMLYAYYFNFPITMLYYLFLTITIMAATSGDLFESYLKRRARLKDAGTLLPGHGGLLDRLDGFLGAIVVMYPLRKLFIKLIYFSS